MNNYRRQPVPTSRAAPNTDQHLRLSSLQLTHHHRNVIHRHSASQAHSAVGIHDHRNELPRYSTTTLTFLAHTTIEMKTRYKPVLPPVLSGHTPHHVPIISTKQFTSRAFRRQAITSEHTPYREWYPYLKHSKTRRTARPRHAGRFASNTEHHHLNLNQHHTPKTPLKHTFTH